MKWEMTTQGRMMVMCFAYALAVGLGVLLGPAAAQAQSTVSPVWIQHAWTNESGLAVRAHAIDVYQGNVYVAGHADFMRSGATFGETHIDSDSSHAFLVKYDIHGEQQWVRAGSFSAPPTYEVLLSGFHLAVNERGIVTGEGYDYLMDAGMLTNGSVSLNRYTADGTHEWTTTIHPPVAFPGYQPGFAVGLGFDQAGNLYTAGVYRDTLVLSPDTLASFPLEAPEHTGDVFLASYTPDGMLQWSRRIGGPRHDAIAGWATPEGVFAVDGEGNTYLGGFFGRGATFGEGQAGAITLTRDAYGLASYDAEGTLRWVRTERDLGVSDNAGPSQVDVDAGGNLFVTWAVTSTGGTYTATVGDTTFTDPGYGGEFLTKIAPDGTLLWARQIESDGNEIVTDVAVDARGHVYVSGSFDGMYLRLEDTELRKQDLQIDREDGFIAHYDAEGRLLWVGHAAGPEVDRIMAIAVSPEGDLYVAGEFREEVRLGTETLAAQVLGGMGMFVAKYAADTITSSEAPETPVPAIAASAFPNPFRGRATIRYEVPGPGHVRLAVYDVLGREVALLVDDVQSTGTHEAVFEGSDLPSGVYFYRLAAAGRTLSNTLILQR